MTFQHFQAQPGTAAVVTVGASDAPSSSSGALGDAPTVTHIRERVFRAPSGFRMPAYRIGVT